MAYFIESRDSRDIAVSKGYSIRLLGFSIGAYFKNNKGDIMSTLGEKVSLIG